MRSNLTLQPLYKSPPPIYLHPLFVAEVGDVFLEGTGMDGGSLVSSIATLSLTYDRLIRAASTVTGFEIPKFENGNPSSHTHALTFEALRFTHDDMQAINFLSETVRQSKDLFQKFGKYLLSLYFFEIRFLFLTLTGTQASF